MNHYKLQKILFLSILIVSVNGFAVAGGIPVIDSSNLAQQVQQVVSWGKQLQAMKEQFDQQQAQYQSLTGQRGFGNVLNDPKLRQYLPSDWKKIYTEITRPESPNTSALCFGNTGVSLSYCESEAKKNYLDRANYEQAYAIATSEQAQIQGLVDQINNTSDPKAIAELQARIAGEQAKIQNAVVQLQLSTQLAEIQNKLVTQAKREAFINNLHQESGKPLTFPSPITNWE